MWVCLEEYRSSSTSSSRYCGCFNFLFCTDRWLLQDVSFVVDWGPIPARVLGLANGWMCGMTVIILLVLAFITTMADILPVLRRGRSGIEECSKGCIAPRVRKFARSSGCPRKPPWILRKASSMRTAVLCLFVPAVILPLAEGTTLQSNIDALLALRDNQDGAVLRALNWRGDPCAKKWKGVECDADGRTVVELRIAGMQTKDEFFSGASWNDNYQPLTGTIPPQLGDLTSLTVLDLSSNQLSGAIPPQLGNLRRLEILDLSKNKLNGSIPVELGYLLQLQTLRLSRNRLRGSIPPQIGNLERLTTLTLSYNLLRGPMPPELQGLTRLESLVVYGNRIGGPIPLWVQRLGNLRKLMLSGNRLSGPIPPWLGNLRQLTTLDLSANSLSGPIPSQLGSLVNLEVLILSANNLSGPIPPHLGNLSNLIDLYLQDNSLVGPLPRSLENLQTLSTLDISMNKLTGSIPAWLASLQNLNYLAMSTNNLSGSIPEELGNLRRLEVLILSENNLTGPIPLGLSKFPKLVSLIVSSNNLTGPIPPELFNISSLSTVELASNYLYGHIPSNVLNLVTLDLSYNSLTGSIPSDLFSLVSGIKLDLSSNFLSGPLPSNTSGWPEDSNLANNFLGGTLPTAASRFSVGLNCLNISNRNLHEVGQRDGQACAEYYPELSCSCTPPKVIGINGSCYCVSPLRFDALFTCNNSDSLGNFSANLDHTIADLATAFSVSTKQMSLLSLSTTRSSVTLAFYILPPGHASEFSPYEIFSIVGTASNPGFGSSISVPYFDPGVGYITEIVLDYPTPPSAPIAGNPYSTPAAHPPPQPRREAGASLSTPKARGGPSTAFILGTVSVAVLLGLSATAVLLFFFHRHFRRLRYRPISMTIEQTSVRKWSLAELRSATGNFDIRHILGTGGFAVVYKAEVAGTLMAVKRLAVEGIQGLETDFVREVQTIGRIHHRNLLRLQGYCVENKEYLLVYDFMPNGNLEDSLFNRPEEKPLSWPMCAKILLGTARGIAHLHEGCNEKIIHRDIKPANILLDKQFAACVADFGMIYSSLVGETQVRTRVAGTPGYVAPEYALTGQLTEKSDVYSFGVVLLVVIGHCRPVEKQNGRHLVDRAFKAAKENQLLDLIAPHFQSEHYEDELRKFVSVALLCIQPAWQRRPSMGEVVQMLCGKSNIRTLDIRLTASVPAPACAADLDGTGNQGHKE